MSQDHPRLHVVPDRAGSTEPEPAAAAEEDVRDPLLARAEQVGELPLEERPAAFDRLNQALVDELQALEDS